MEPLNIPLATWCLSWLTNHLPHEFLVISVILTCLFIAMIIVLIIVIVFLILTWAYIYVFATLSNLIPRILKRITRYLWYTPAYRVAQSLPNASNHAKRSTTSKNSPISRPPHLPPSPTLTPSGKTGTTSSLAVAKKAIPTTTSVIPHQNQNTALVNRCIHPSYPDPNRSFIRFHEQLYARVHLSPNTRINDIIPAQYWEPMPKAIGQYPRVPVPPLPVQTVSSGSSTTNSPPPSTRN